jgi:hypothetical protein
MSKRSAPRTKNGRARASSSFRVAGVILVGLAGLLGLVLSIHFAISVRDGKRHHAFISELPALTSASGSIGILEGRIAGETPTLRDGFVAYVREVYRGNPGRNSQSKWHFDHRQTQPLTVETAGGNVRISNTDYQFDTEVHDWTHAEVQESPPTFTQGAVRTRGLLPGKPVMIVGTVKPGTSGQEAVAHTIVGMDRVTYLQALNRSNERMTSALPWMFIITPFLIVYAGRGVRRILREPWAAFPESNA